jgi:hypothetical protein
MHRIAMVGPVSLSADTEIDRETIWPHPTVMISYSPYSALLLGFLADRV